ncbi:MAG: hypothetical protein EOM50_21330 [Erysipelotrichia bacterium]|nr:hypothetical protein [Erysipelotrichia bacterium]
MKKFLKVETKYNEHLADAQVLVVTLLSNNNRTWDFIVDTDAYHTLRLNEDYLVTTQDDWLGTLVGIRFFTIANAINLKATVLKPVPDDDQVEILDATEDDTEEQLYAEVKCIMKELRLHDDDDQVEVLDETEDDTENVDFPLTPTPTSWMLWAALKHMSNEEDHQLDVEYKWLMEDKAAPLKAVHHLWEYKYTGIGSHVIDLQSSIHDLLVLKRFAEDKLSELSELSDKEVDTYNKFYNNNVHFPLKNPYDDMLRVLYKGHKDKNKK